MIRPLAAAAAVGLAASQWLIWAYAPVEQTMGIVQKIFYLHLPLAWWSLVSFFVVFAASVLLLARKDRKWDRLARAAAELGVLFSGLALVTGSLWGKPIWNVWWTWDPRLTTVTIMELAYAAYLMLRSGIDDPERRARFGAVYAIVVFISVPVTFFSIRLLRTIHPVVIGSGAAEAEGGFSMTPMMVQTFVTSLVAYSFVFISLLWHRIRLGRLAEKVEQAKLRLVQ